MANDTTTEASGVQQLIDRLRREGVDKGQTEADAVLEAARRQAMELLDDAQSRADAMLKEAQTEADRTRRAGEEAIRLAGRDSILELTEELRDGCKRTLQRLVSHALRDDEFLRRLILEIARRSVPDDADVRLNVQLLDDDPSPENDAALQRFAESLAGQSLRDGLTFEVTDSDAPGVRVQIVDGDLEVDLTDETLTQVLLRHLSPRFRELLDV
ncbi:hypothetical protein [Alienimonas chondri]|uniref:V-type proton ATPase subunit E n=1 Tax=Alienimonas chondri TaxID=2681879 RepID=A0ABX1VIT9_9PLAN|nr:hypothetical protein [Alienimonas chondri]NNJ28048.1 V-type proton ATPase subunit E [Alienimonas chondri]